MNHYELSKQTADGLGWKAGIFFGLLCLLGLLIAKADFPNTWEWAALLAVVVMVYQGASFLLVTYYIRLYVALYASPEPEPTPRPQAAQVVYQTRVTSPRPEGAALIRSQAGEWAERTDWDGLAEFLSESDRPPFSRSALAEYVDQRFYSLRESTEGNKMSFPQLMVAVKAARAVSNENGQTNYQWTADAAEIISALAAEL
jgi:hypothetical protein